MNSLPWTSQCAQWPVVWHQEDRPSEEEGDWDLETDLGSPLQGILGSQRPQERSRSGLSIDSEWTCPLGSQTLYIVKRDSQTEPSKGQDREPLLLSLRQYWKRMFTEWRGRACSFPYRSAPRKGSLVPSMNCRTSIPPIRPSEFFLAAAHIHAERCPSS